MAAVAAKSLQSCPTLCDPIDGSPPGSSVPGILQARTLEWVAISFSNACMHAKSLQSRPTLCNPMDSSPPGSSIHRILPARILEWGAISFSGESVEYPPITTHCARCYFTHSYRISSQSLKEIGILPILQMSKPRSRDIKQFFQTLWLQSGR